MSKLLFNFNKGDEFNLSLDTAYEPAIFGHTNSTVSIDSDFEAELKLQPVGMASSFMTSTGKTQTENGFSIGYTVEPKDVSVKIDVDTYEDINAVSQTVTVTNDGDKQRVLSRIGSNANGVCYNDGELIKDRLSDGSILIHYCISKWQGEAQWRTATPEDLGVYYCTQHWWERSLWRIDSVSSFSCDAYFPILIVEDKKRNECWFFEIEGGHSWFFEVYVTHGTHAQYFSVRMGEADERLGMYQNLNKGESYTSSRSVYGVVKGGFEEGVKELIKYKRKTTVAKSGCPFTFNDYMNCNWGMPNTAKLIPLIDRAAELGAEYFCIDDGWQTKQGVWDLADERFEGGVKGILDYIKSKGLKPGVWFEFECAPLELKDRLGTGEIFIKRHNGEIASPHRPKGNMRSKVYIDYLNSCVDKMYDMGVRFIKNDHNNHELVGTDMYGDCPAKGLKDNAKASMDFIDGIYARHPDMVIENCGSGAMRSDWGTLKHFNVQSTSDQEDYVAYTSIIGGSLALMPPEKAGIWVYPYPLIFDDFTLEKIPEEKLKDFEDGEQTVYNVVNGLLGAFYLSGKIGQMDDKNFGLLKEGVDLYKSLYPFILKAYPVFPMGMCRMTNKNGYAFGITNDDKSEVYLAVFNMGDNPKIFTMDLEKYGLKNCEVIYPKNFGGMDFEFNGKTLTVSASKGKQARLIKLTK
ncbi:MAG: alpha-galactosidase [Clostridiales bacterium]|nr:alpha-galactosidase [Clostridiales bacterium]